MTGVDKNYQQAIRTIFIADDDPNDRQFLSDALSHINPSFQIQTFSNGKDLCSMLQNSMPDLIFLDLDMPVKNGLECLKEIREDEKIKDVRIVVFSSSFLDVNIETAYEMGAHLYMIKPSFFQALLATLISILKMDWNNPDTIKGSLLIEGKYKAFL